MMLLEFYHQAVFGYFQEMYDQRLQSALYEQPRNFRRAKFLQKITAEQKYEGEEAWDICDKYLIEIEREMQAILRRHSVLFWIHLYRRIGVTLASGHESKTDANTVGLVRGIAELAISKHGNLDCDDDVQLSSRVHFKDILGGHYKRVCKKLYGPAGAAKTFRDLAESEQWVLTKFEIRDFFDIYLAEGLAYEYWRVTALMRAIGKGAGFILSDGDWPAYTESPELSQLIISYDERIKNTRFSTSLVGSWFDTQTDQVRHSSAMLIPYYNVERREIPRLFKSFGLQVPREAHFATNFLAGPFDIIAFRDAHLFLAEAFERATKISFDAFLLTLWGLQNFALLPPRVLFEEAKRGEQSDLHEPGGPIFMHFFNYLQRAYILFGKDVAALAAEIVFRAEAFEGPDFAYTRQDIEACLARLMLSEAKRDQIALWSGGRRFPLIPFGDCLIIDLQGLPSLLQTMFYKVQYEQTERGSIFEEAFREALRVDGFEGIFCGEVAADNGEMREIDASVRIRDELFLFECRSIERPLDFELGRPRTLERRREYLDQKIDQVLSLREFILAHPVGRNYDYSWAKTVSAFVVSPFIEWTWDCSSRLWHDDETPRILGADEAIAHLHKVLGTKLE